MIHTDEDDEFDRIARENRLKSSGMECCTYDCIQGRDCPIRKAKANPVQRKPLTNGEIYTAYITATNQTLRAQDERLALAFARAIEAAHGIK